MKILTYTLILVALWNMPAAASGVGFTRFGIDDPMGGKMQVSLWYPTDTPSETVVIGPFSFPGTREAKPNDDMAGLVVISHGTQGSDLGHRNVAVALADMGFIVAAPLHPRDNFRDNSGVGRRIVMEGRPRQVSAVVDGLLSHASWGRRIDANRIGAFGFSLGGYTVLSVLGAEPDMSHIITHCDRPDTDPFCDVIRGGYRSSDNTLAQEYRTEFTNLTDTRFCAAVIVDPVAVPFSDEAVVQIKTPYVQVWRPENQNVLLASAHASRVVEQLNKRAKFEETEEIVVPHAQHYSFIAPFPSQIKASLPKALTSDSPKFNREEFHIGFADRVAEFLRSRLNRCGGEK